ncbi:MAG: hypothetical protein QXT25_02365 [Candidatus Anstonellaceae archaeon]
MKPYAAIFVLCMVALSNAALHIDSYTVVPEVLKPGQEGAITFSIKNVVPAGSTSTSQLEDVQVYFAAPAGITYKLSSPYVVGSIPVGGSAVVSIPFKVNSNVKGGAISAPFFISIKDADQLKTLNVVIRVSNPPILSISADKQTIASTDILNLNITNNGGLASRATLKIAPQGGFSLSGKTMIYIGDIKDSVTIQVPIDSRNANEGVSSIPFVISYVEEGGSSTEEIKPLLIAVKKEKADVVFSQLSKVITARSNKLVLSVKNTGRALEDFKVFLEDQKLQPKESNQAKLGSLAAGQEKTFSFEVFADVQPGVHQAALRLKWVEDDVEKEQQISIPVVVTSDAATAIFVDSKPAPIVVGGEHTLSVLVSNIGSYKINNVEVALNASSGFDILNAQASQYIGGLEADDFSTVQYKVRVKAKEPGTYPIQVSVRYKDQSGQWISDVSEIPLIVRAAEEQRQNGLPLIIGGLVVAGGAAYWYFKLRKKGKVQP